METIIKMLNVLAWITVIWAGIVLVIKQVLHIKYQSSYEKHIDRIEGRKITFLHNSMYWFIAFIISLVYLIVK